MVSGGGDGDAGCDVCGDGRDDCDVLGYGGEIAFDGGTEKDRRIGLKRQGIASDGGRGSDDGEGGQDRRRGRR